MDSQLLRLNQMSYQHHKQFLSQQRAGQQAALNANQQQQQQAPLVSQRQHYSNRQQLSAPDALLQQKQHQQHHKQAIQQGRSGALTSASSGSEQDEQVPLSSLSTATTSKSNQSSEAAILSASQRASSSQHQQQQQQYHNQMLRQQQAQQRHLQAGGAHVGQHHRQAALQAHTLAVLPRAGKAHQAHKSQNLSSSDQLTTSSDQTIDELHQLAPHHRGSPNYARHHHQMSRYETSGGGGLAASNLSSSNSQSGSRFLLGVLFTLAELLLFATVFLWLYWAYQHDDGLAWQTDRKQQFNTHAALMLFGFVFLSGQAMLIHRSFSCCTKIYTKILHTILFVLATSAISLGLILAYTAQENVGANNKPIMHFYSLHAWCGLITLALFALQFVFGFVSFLILLCCDQATENYRAALLPIHKTFGLIIFSLAVATSLMGLLQTARSRLSSKLQKNDYHELAESGIIINLIGLALILLAILMPYIIRNLDIKRAANSFRSEFDRHLNKLSQLDMRI